MPIIRFLLVLLLVKLGHPGSGLAAPGPGADLENLEYRVSLGLCSEVALVHLRLAQVGPNRGKNELFNRWRPRRRQL